MSCIPLPLNLAVSKEYLGWTGMSPKSGVKSVRVSRTPTPCQASSLVLPHRTFPSSAIADTFDVRTSIYVFVLSRICYRGIAIADDDNETKRLGIEVKVRSWGCACTPLDVARGTSFPTFAVSQAGESCGGDGNDRPPIHVFTVLVMLC